MNADMTKEEARTVLAVALRRIRFGLVYPDWWRFCKDLGLDVVATETMTEEVAPREAKRTRQASAR